MTQQIVLGEGRVKISLVRSEDRVGILLAPMETAYPIGHTFELNEGRETQPPHGSVVIWGLNPEGMRVLQDAVNALELALRRAARG